VHYKLKLTVHCVFVNSDSGLVFVLESYLATDSQSWCCLEHWELQY